MTHRKMLLVSVARLMFFGFIFFLIWLSPTRAHGQAVLKEDDFGNQKKWRLVGAEPLLVQNDSWLCTAGMMYRFETVETKKERGRMGLSLVPHLSRRSLVKRWGLSGAEFFNRHLFRLRKDTRVWEGNAISMACSILPGKPPTSAEVAVYLFPDLRDKVASVTVPAICFSKEPPPSNHEAPDSPRPSNVVPIRNASFFVR